MHAIHHLLQYYYHGFGMDLKYLYWEHKTISLF